MDFPASPRGFAHEPFARAKQAQAQQAQQAQQVAANGKVWDGKNWGNHRPTAEPFSYVKGMISNQSEFEWGWISLCFSVSLYPKKIEKVSLYHRFKGFEGSFIPMLHMYISARKS